MAALVDHKEAVKADHKAALADRKEATKVAHKAVDKVGMEDKEVGLADRKVVVKADQKTADRADPAEDKEADLANRTDSSRLTEEEAQKADRATLQIIKIQEEEEAETLIIRNNMVGKTILGIMAHGKEDNTHRIVKTGEVMIAKAIIK